MSTSELDRNKYIFRKELSDIQQKLVEQIQHTEVQTHKNEEKTAQIKMLENKIQVGI